MIARSTSELIGGAYELGDLLGVGGTATVYEATDLQHGEPVALKMLHPHLCEDPAARSGFLKEAERAARVRHPNLVRVREWGEYDAAGAMMVWIAMDLVRGPTLDERVTLHGPLPPAAAARVVEGVLAGLAAAHAAGLVHRDVTPQNIVLADTQTPEMVADPVGSTAALTAASARLLDFGLADATGRPARTTSGEVIGTANFISPEQAQGLPVRAAADIYQAGAVLYYAVTGRPPFRRANVADTLRAHLTAPPPAASALAPGAQPLDRIVTRAMTKTPARRFRDAEEFRDALREAFPLPVSPAVEPASSAVYPAHAAIAAHAASAASAASGAINAASGGVRSGVASPVDPRIDARPDPDGSATTVLPTTAAARYLSHGDVASPTDTDPDLEPGARRLSTLTIALAVVVAIAMVGIAIFGFANAQSNSWKAPPPATTDPVATETEPVPKDQPVPEPPPTTNPGPVTIAVPELRGSLAEAEAQLLTAGLTLGTVTLIDGIETADRVLSQYPAAGNSMLPNAAVNLTVASGNNSVPQVAGMTVASATSQLQAAGFTVAPLPAGATTTTKTTGSLPAAGAVLKVGARVTLQVVSADDGETPPTDPPGDPGGDSDGERHA